MNASQVRYRLRPSMTLSGPPAPCSSLGAALVVLGPDEVRQHVVPAPAGQAHRRPLVVVGAVAADVDHRVARGRSAECPAPRQIPLAAAEPRLRVGDERPVVLAQSPAPGRRRAGGSRRRRPAGRPPAGIRSHPDPRTGARPARTPPIRRPRSRSHRWSSPSPRASGLRRAFSVPGRQASRRARPARAPRRGPDAYRPHPERSRLPAGPPGVMPCKPKEGAAMVRFGFEGLHDVPFAGGERAEHGALSHGVARSRSGSERRSPSSGSASTGLIRSAATACPGQPATGDRQRRQPPALPNPPTSPGAQ